MNYAVVESGGKQYKVTKGSTFILDNMNLSKDSSVVLDKVLLMVSDSSVEVGMPYIQGAVVKAKFVDTVRGEKLSILQYKAKSNYRRRVGFKKTSSKLLVEDIVVEKPVSKTKTLEAKTAKKI